MTVALKIRSWATLPLGARGGTKRCRSWNPAAAALPAREEAALPVEEQAMVSAPPPGP